MKTSFNTKGRLGIEKSLIPKRRRLEMKAMLETRQKDTIRMKYISVCLKLPRFWNFSCVYVNPRGEWNREGEDSAILTLRRIQRMQNLTPWRGCASAERKDRLLVFSKEFEKSWDSQREKFPGWNQNKREGINALKEIRKSRWVLNWRSPNKTSHVQ